jgi:solute carrier family 30 (zinc transporter), member 1
VSIILEALQRFLDPPEVENPKLILIVGSFGLLSNIVGFFVLGGHGHSHGGEGHDHDHDHDDEHGHEHPHDRNEASAAEEGRARAADAVTSVDGPAMDVLPHVIVARAGDGAKSPETVRRVQVDSPTLDPSEQGSRSPASRGWERRRASSLKHGRLQSIDDLSLHPASSRRNIINYIRSNDEETDASSVEEAAMDENTPLIGNGHGEAARHGHTFTNGDHKTSGHTHHHRRDSATHKEHHHAKSHSKKRGGGGGHGHSHGDMGMNAMILHVIGDFLGNIGVIVSALIIWLTPWEGRFYADPAVSLFITAIILHSAIPLTKATSKVLLQATPDEIDIQEIKEDIQALPGVVSCHHIHVWQLSDTKIVASLHVQVAFPITEEGGEKYMELAKQARKCLHAYGIHSATIQPEFCLDRRCNHAAEAARNLDGQSSPRGHCGNGESMPCLLECVDDCKGQGCCGGSSSQNGDGASRRSSHSGKNRASGHVHAHDHDDDHGHDHAGHSH